MKKILATLALTLGVLTAVAQQQTSDTSRIEVRFSSTMKAYAQSPEAVDVLFDMANLYYDNSTSMRNLPLAMYFATKAENNYLELMQVNKHRELTRLLRRGIVLTTVQHLKEAVHNAALSAVKKGDNMDLMEMDAYIEVFANDPEIVNIVRQKRIHQVYEADMKEATPQSYYHIIVSFPGTTEATNAEAKLAKVAATLFDGVNEEAGIDSLAAQYELSPSVARAATRKKSRLAFTQATDDNTIAAYKDFLRRYPSSDESQQVREMLDNLLAIQYNTLHTAVELADFADSNADNELAEQALAQIRHIIIDKHDVQAARLYLNRFRFDPHYNEVFAVYYSWFADEGNGDLLNQFEEENPDSPLRYALERDQERAMILDNIDLMEPYSEEDFSEYSMNIRQSVGKKLSFVPLQRMIQQMTAAGEYETASNRINQYEICFDNVMHDEYTELQNILTAPADRLESTTLPLEGDILNPCINPSDNLLYFNRIKDGKRHMCYATAEQEFGGMVEFSTDIEGDPTLFGFFDNGNKLLLGSKGDILIAERDGSAWRISEIPPYPVNTDYIETDAFMLPDGSGMLLASDRPGGQNLQPSGAYYHGDTALATDIWFIPLRDGRWGTPVNLGITINTPYCERSPHMGSDLRTLYFITDSRGMGYGDIYTATRSSIDDWTAWSKPRNLGRETNSCFSEASLSLSPDEKQILISTNASGNYVCRTVALKQRPAESTLNYTLDLLGTENDIGIRVADISQQEVSQMVEYESQGSSVSFKIHKDKRYAIFADDGSAFFPAIIIDPSHRPLRLQGYPYSTVVSLDKAVPLETLMFETAKSKLSPVALLQLEQLASFMMEYPAAVEIAVDVAGPDDAPAYSLSLERGMAVKNYLSAKGIDGRRLTVSAYGNVRTKRGTAEGVSVQFR